jgi:hypothetical protein
MSAPTTDATDEPSGPFVIPMEPEPPTDPLGFFAEHGLVPGDPTPLKFQAYHDMIASAHALGGRRFADWCAGICEQSGIKYRLRLATRFAVTRAYEKVRTEWCAGDVTERATRAAESAEQSSEDAPAVSPQEMMQRLQGMFGAATPTPPAPPAPSASPKPRTP